MQRVTVHGKRREMGLGGFPTLGLADARKLSERWRSMAAAGRDPIKERESEERAANRKDISLEIITQDAFDARKAELKDDGKAGNRTGTDRSRTTDELSPTTAPCSGLPASCSGPQG